MATMVFVGTTILIAAIDEAVQRDGHLLARATRNVPRPAVATSYHSARRIEYEVALACWDQ